MASVVKAPPFTLEGLIKPFLRGLWLCVSPSCAAFLGLMPHVMILSRRWTQRVRVPCHGLQHPGGCSQPVLGGLKSWAASCVQMCCQRVGACLKA